MRRDDFELPVAPANDRPNDRFRCGYVCHGEQRSVHSCPLGPSASGVCRHDKEPCVPVATARLRARRWKTIAFVGGLLGIVMGSYLWGREFYKPGPLSTPHAQILAGQLTTSSCAACHPQAESSPLAWYKTGHDADALLQSDRCMDCHHTRLPRDFARTAHNLSATQLQKLQANSRPVTMAKSNRWLPSPSFELTDVACSACHREHGGPNASLTSLSDSQCQTCHSNRFTSFAVDHPSWNQWPYTTTEPIAFDHRTHSQRHFPGARDEAGNAAQFDCLRCHGKTDSGEFARISDYATACSNCHDKSLNQQVGERLDLFVLPGLIDPDEKVVGNWPAAATGFYDGKVGPLARLLLPTDAVIQQAISSIPGEGDFTRINPAELDQRQAAGIVAVAIRKQIEAMAVQGPIPAVSAVEVQPGPLRRILKGLPPQLIWDASQRWFNGSGTQYDRVDTTLPANSLFQMAAARKPDDSNEWLLEADDELLSGSASADDPLLEQTAAPNLPKAANDTAIRSRPTVALDHRPDTMQPDGGWYIDDSRMAISYRGHGHADPVIQAAIELAAGLSLDHSIRRELLASGPASACFKCHLGANAMGQMQWKPSPMGSNTKAQFTKFVHRPHNHLPVLSNCQHCHQINDDSQVIDNSAFLTTVSMSDETVTIHSPHDFLPLARQACASCHTAAAAGDACIKCHRYHAKHVPSAR